MTPAATAKLRSTSKDDHDIPSPNLRGLIRRSSLLNFGIILSALAFAAYHGMPATAVLVLVALQSVVVWSATFVIWVVLTSVANFRRLGRLLTHRPGRRPAFAGDLADEWLDGPA